MGILKNLNIVNLYRVKSTLKFKINVNLPRLLCIVISAALNGEFEWFGGLCVDCYYMTCYYVILLTISVWKFWFAVHPFDLICSALQPFDLVRSEIFDLPFIRSTSSVQIIFVSRLSVGPHPYKKFKKPFIRSTSFVRKSVPPFFFFHFYYPTNQCCFT